jgi:hypothetical protein
MLDSLWMTLTIKDITVWRNLKPSVKKIDLLALHITDKKFNFTLINALKNNF